MFDKFGDFDRNSMSPIKCAGCVQGVLCGHKTGKFDKFTYPYHRKYLQTKKVPFPEELKKKDGEAKVVAELEGDDMYFDMILKYEDYLLDKDF